MDFKELFSFPLLKEEVNVYAWVKGRFIDHTCVSVRADAPDAKTYQRWLEKIVGEVAETHLYDRQDKDVHLYIRYDEKVLHAQDRGQVSRMLIERELAEAIFMTNKYRTERSYP